MVPVVKTSGSLGMHVAAPVDAGATFGDTRRYARDLAEALAAATPDEVIARSERASRPGRVYVDWVQNHRGRQLVAPWSPRATAIPRVSLPLAWDEVERLAAGAGGHPDVGFDRALRRMRTSGGLWLDGRPTVAASGQEPVDLGG